jgi:hypothetical protein
MSFPTSVNSQVTDSESPGEGEVSGNATESAERSKAGEPSESKDEHGDAQE